VTGEIGIDDQAGFADLRGLMPSSQAGADIAVARSFQTMARCTCRVPLRGPQFLGGSALVGDADGRATPLGAVACFFSSLAAGGNRPRSRCPLIWLIARPSRLRKCCGNSCCAVAEIEMSPRTHRARDVVPDQRCQHMGLCFSWRCFHVCRDAVAPKQADWGMVRQITLRRPFKHGPIRRGFSSGRDEPASRRNITAGGYGSCVRVGPGRTADSSERGSEAI